MVAFRFRQVFALSVPSSNCFLRVNGLKSLARHIRYVEVNDSRRCLSQRYGVVREWKHQGYVFMGDRRAVPPRLVFLARLPEGRWYLGGPE